MRVIIIIAFLAGLGGEPPRMPAEPGAAAVLSDPEWVEFLENMEMLEEYGDLIDVEAAEPDEAKPDGRGGVNSGGDDGDRDTE